MGFARKFAKAAFGKTKTFSSSILVVCLGSSRNAMWSPACCARQLS